LSFPGYPWRFRSRPLLLRRKGGGGRAVGRDVEAHVVGEIADQVAFVRKAPAGAVAVDGRAADGDEGIAAGGDEAGGAVVDDGGALDQPGDEAAAAHVNTFRAAPGDGAVADGEPEDAAGPGHQAQAGVVVLDRDPVERDLQAARGHEGVEPKEV